MMRLSRKFITESNNITERQLAKEDRQIEVSKSPVLIRISPEKVCRLTTGEFPATVCVSLQF